MSFAGSIQMILFSMLICTIGSQGGPNKMAAANFFWLHFLDNRSHDPVFCLRSVFETKCLFSYSVDMLSNNGIQ